MQAFFITLLQIVATQIAGVLGIFFVCGFVLAQLQRATQKLYLQSVGWRGILWTAWIGTPIHEIGHLVLCKLFHHRIIRVSLFAPNPVTGRLGSVEHDFDRHSLYQRIGNFFIGAAPLIFGSAFLVLLLELFVPDGRGIFLPLTYEPGSWQTIAHATSLTLTRLFTTKNIQAWNFWVFLYISLCIASHIAPSKEDQRSMWSGLVWLIFLLAIIGLMDKTSWFFFLGGWFRPSSFL